MRFLLSLILPISFAISTHAAVTKVEEVNLQLPFWGTSWAVGAGAVSGYYPSFYTGFAPRAENPERFHVRLARGNQTRVSLILDDQAVTNYLFDLAKRHDFYRQAFAQKVIQIPEGVSLPQWAMFNQIIESPVYGILPFIEQAKRGQVTREEAYAKALSLIQHLNPGRLFSLKLNLTHGFLKWRDQVRSGNLSAATPAQAIVAIQSLLWGRINYVAAPSAEVMKQLQDTMAVAREGEDAAFLSQAFQLFKIVTGKKYEFSVLSEQKTWQPALQCTDVRACYLIYPEFTAIYPTGFVRASTMDRFGNSIGLIRTPGLWPFVAHGGGRDVDNIRDDPYYGWAPKMDYQDIHNGFHNPAVRFSSSDLTPSVKSTLGLSANHTSLWAVKRGAVSHGCSRLPLGHVWEFRHLLPVTNEKMVQVYYFGNMSQDFDLYDIDGDGKLEVMGVEYFLSYDLKGSSGLSSREGRGLEISKDNRVAFYTKLFGAKQVFEANQMGAIQLIDPSVSMPSHLDLKREGVSARVTVNGRFPLYEQTYERDKVQYYAFPRGGIAKPIVRLFGRVRGCAPWANKVDCGEEAFDREAQTLVRTYVPWR